MASGPRCVLIILIYFALEFFSAPAAAEEASAESFKTTVSCSSYEHAARKNPSVQRGHQKKAIKNQT